MTRARTPTIVDVAAAAGVSKSAVSRALLGQGDVSPETRRRIEEAARELGYVANAMARSLVSARTRNLGVVLRDVRKPYYAFLQASMQEQAEQRKYRIVATTNTGPSEVADALREIKNLISLQVDGLVIAPARLPTSEFAPFLDRVPIVVAGRRESTPGISSVAVDDADGGRSLAEHVASLGHRRVAVALVDERYSVRYYSRGKAMVEALKQAGVAVETVSSPTDLDAAQRVRESLDSMDVTAIMCPTDASAIDLLELIRDRGRSDLERYSVTGFDGYGPLESPYIGLTTYRVPQEEIGRIAIDLLVDRIEGRSALDQFVSLRGTVVPGRTARVVG